MAQITLKGNAINTNGDLPATGSDAPDFSLVKTDLCEGTLKEFAGKKVLLNIFPSLDTPVCATSIRTFNKDAAGMDNTVVVCASRDLPFAHNRFCTAEGIEGVVSMSEMRGAAFGEGLWRPDRRRSSCRPDGPRCCGYRREWQGRLHRTGP